MLFSLEYSAAVYQFLILTICRAILNKWHWYIRNEENSILMVISNFATKRPYFLLKSLLVIPQSGGRLHKLINANLMWQIFSIFNFSISWIEFSFLHYLSYPHIQPTNMLNSIKSWSYNFSLNYQQFILWWQFTKI